MCTMLFFLIGNFNTIIQSTFPLTETLEGQSAFRLKSPFSEQGDQKLQKRCHAPPEDGALDVRDLSPKPSHEAETNKDQWYSTEEGMQLFGKIHGALQEQFEITRTSRDTTTHDLCLSLKFQKREFAVDFPYNFPHVSAILIRAYNHREAIRLTETSSGGENTEGPKDENPPESAKDKKNAQGTDAEGNLDPGKIPQSPPISAEDEKNAQGTEAEGTLDPGKIPQSPPTSAQDEMNVKGTKAEGNLDPEKIPQLLVQEIRRLVIGTHV